MNALSERKRLRVKPAGRWRVTFAVAAPIAFWMIWLLG